METIRKAATASRTDAGTLRVVASNETPDRTGDVIKAASWQLDNYRANPVVLFAHDNTRIIGKAAVEVVDGELIADITLADRGTSADVDMVHALVDQGILRAVSVGVRALQRKANKHGGYDFLKSELLEITLCAVPMNPAALAVAKSLDLDADTMNKFFTPAAQTGASRIAVRRTLLKARYRSANGAK